jgi:hypothetical protein
VPKLNKAMAKQVDKAKEVGGGFEPFPAGKYIAELEEVEAKISSAGNPMWAIKFQNVVNLEGEEMPGRLFYNLNLPTTDEMPEDYAKGPEKWKQYQDLCRGRLKNFFSAFGYSMDSDTDEMIGDKAILIVGIGTINKGPRTGQSTNQVNGLESLDSVEGADAIGSGDGDKDEF